MNVSPRGVYFAITWKGPPNETGTPNDNFIDAILGRAEPQTTPLNGVIQSQLMDAIYESAATGRIARPAEELAEAVA